MWKTVIILTVEVVRHYVLWETDTKYETSEMLSV